MTFMMDLHAEEHGYEEMLPPVIVNRDSLTGTGQLPKFEEDVFKLEETDYFMIPTAEVPVTNFYRDEILPAEALPQGFARIVLASVQKRDLQVVIHVVLIRQHQFNKVELVRFVKPESHTNN